MNQPKVSVVIPVYNAEPYLRECLESIVHQTLQEVEILCVDDGSTDGSSAILREYAERDNRIVVLTQLNAGAGAARNTGMAAAHGEYLVFLDADDFFESALLKSLFDACSAESADICLCGANEYDTVSGQYISMPWMVNCSVLPDKHTFSYKDVPEEIFFITSPSPWNMLFQKNFIKRTGLTFQPLRRTNDLFFVMSSLVKAERITAIPDVLVHYRINVQSSLQATNDKGFFEFVTALAALRYELERTGLMEEIKPVYCRLSLRICLYNLECLKTPAMVAKLYSGYQNGIFPLLGLDNLPREYIKAPKDYEQYIQITTAPILEYLAARFPVENGAKSEMKASPEINLPAEDEADRPHVSWPYRIRRAITWLLRKVYSGIRCCREHGLKYTIKLVLKKSLRSS